MVQPLPLGPAEASEPGKRISTINAPVSGDSRRSMAMASKVKIRVQKNGQKEGALLCQPLCTVVNTAKELIWGEIWENEETSSCGDRS